MKKLQLFIVALFLNNASNTMHGSAQSTNNTSSSKPKLTIHTYNSARDRRAIKRMIDQYPATAGADINMIEKSFDVEKAIQSINFAEYGITEDMINQFKHRTNNAFTKILRINDETTIGFANYSKEPQDSSCHIHMVGIHEQHQNKGYARQLLTVGMNNFKKEGIKSAFITVHESNTAARRLYSKLGFKPYQTYNAPQNMGFLFLQKTLD